MDFFSQCLKLFNHYLVDFAISFAYGMLLSWIFFLFQLASWICQCWGVLGLLLWQVYHLKSHQFPTALILWDFFQRYGCLDQVGHFHFRQFERCGYLCLPCFSSCLRLLMLSQLLICFTVYHIQCVWAVVVDAVLFWARISLLTRLVACAFTLVVALLWFCFICFDFYF